MLRVESWVPVDFGKIKCKLAAGERHCDVHVVWAGQYFIWKCSVGVRAAHIFDFVDHCPDDRVLV